MNRQERRAAKKRGLTVPGQDLMAVSTRSAASAQINLGNVHLGQGRLDDALDCYLRAIELQPDQMDAHNNLCAVLMALGRFDAVAAHCRHILDAKPDYVPGYNILAAALLGAGDAHGALDATRRALTISETTEAKFLFAASLQHLQSIPASSDLEALIVRAISEPWGRPADLAGPCLTLIKSDRDIAGGLARADAAWPSRLTADELFGDAGLRAATHNPLLRRLLENARTNDIAIERYLTSVRLALLEAATSAAAAHGVDEDILAFYCALARQCFINEYVYACTDEEGAQAAALRGSLAAALVSNAPVPVLWPVAAAAYEPLHTLHGSDVLIARRWPACVDALLTQQVREPAQERGLAGQIPRLTAIDDDVSLLVQSQYEENPYPRWVKAAPVGGATTIDARLRGQFPLAKFDGLARTGAVDVLVAGCGTGQQLVDVAQRIAGARVLAVDLSRASLCYAKRQTAALGLRNIDYGQADILQLGTLGRTFDVIDCGGVLHHLGDPLAGWRVLLSLLRRNGVMRIALYSERSRQHVVAARAFVAERGYDRTANGIRRFRQDALALPEGDPVKLVARSPDFFSLSECRDLVFHVQEHRFTLPQIADILTTNGLEFLGFDIDASVQSRYSAQFPADRARTDLAQWDAFEQAHPWTFAGMYQFWVQKRA
jgi:SAM-dependent methyltransferase